MVACYILITPAKNEELYLEETINSVIKQTIRPVLWVIVDDGSTDNTSKIIEKYSDAYSWIIAIHLPFHPRNIDSHVAYVLREGYNYAVNYCLNSNLNYEYLAILDADTIIGENYFESLLEEYEKDQQLGIASGGIYYYINHRLQFEEGLDSTPSGSGRLQKMQCFLDTDGFSIYPVPWDAVADVKANLHGYRTRQFKNLIILHKRFNSCAEGRWNGYVMKGKYFFRFDAHPLYILILVTFFIAQAPHYGGIAFLYGYLCSLLGGDKRIEDEEIRNYYRTTRPKDIVKHILMRYNLIKKSF